MNTTQIIGLAAVGIAVIMLVLFMTDNLDFINPKTADNAPVRPSVTHTSSVIELQTVDQLKKAIKSQEPTAVLVFSERCGHCVRMLPEFDAAAAELDVHVTLNKFNGKNGSAELFKELDVTGVPVLFLAKNGSYRKEVGGRNKEAILKLLKEL